MVILSTLESLSTHIVTLPSTSLCSFCNSCFELLTVATEPVSNTQELLMSTTKVHINIIYTFVHFAILLIHQVFGAVPLPVTISFAVEALSFRLETSGLVNHQNLILFLDFYLRRFQHHEELGNRFCHPLHTIVHHEVLATW